MVDFLKDRKKTILLIVIVSIATLAVSTMTSILLSRYYNLHFPSVGTIKVTAVEVYGGDINITQDGVPFIDWGAVSPGKITNRSFNVSNAGNTPIILSLKIANVTFYDSNNQNVTADLPIETPLNLTWNYNNTVLEPKKEIQVTLALTVSAQQEFLQYLVDYDVKKFSFDIAIAPVE